MFSALALLTVSTGCTALLSPMSGTPVSAIPPVMLGETRNDLIPVPLALLRQDVPQDYLIDAGDILGIYVEGILPPKNENETAVAPPVHFPEPGSDLPPSVGYPIPVRDDGTLPLPLASSIYVRGKTITEVEALVRKAYVVDRQILREGRDQILVTVMRERTKRVIVIREDGAEQELAIAGGQNLRGTSTKVVSGSTRTGAGFTLDMPAYKNDVMHALAQTGGLPGLNAKNEVKVLKASALTPENRNQLVMAMFEEAATKCIDPCDPGYGGLYGGPCGMVGIEGMVENPFAIIIPLRVKPGQMPNINPADVILEDGDIVYIESRETEFFYTGGLLPGGQYPIPRDYDLDVIGAMSIAGSGLGGTVKQSGGGITGSILGGGFGGAIPTQLYIIRKTPCGQEFNILVDLKTAMNDPSQRILVQPGDTLILRYKPCEEVVNFSLVAFFTFGVRELFSN
ncbi:MAG: polysaccharide biosynthesis/export family protein [Planctomycetaceae bacterium]